MIISFFRSASNRQPEAGEPLLSASTTQHDDADEIARAIDELTSENEHLRTLMSEQQAEIQELRDRLAAVRIDWID